MLYGKHNKTYLSKKNQMLSTSKLGFHEYIISFDYVHKWVKHQVQGPDIFVLPVTESLTESLKGELKSRLETLIWYWHWYDPSLSKLTLRMLKVAELVLDVWDLVNVPESFFRINVPPKCWVKIEQVMSTFWPQVTSPTGFMEMLGFGRFTGKKNIKNEINNKYI